MRFVRLDTLASAKNFQALTPRGCSTARQDSDPESVEGLGKFKRKLTEGSLAQSRGEGPQQEDTKVWRGFLRPFNLKNTSLSQEVVACNMESKTGNV